MTRFPTDQCHADPHKPAPLGHGALTCVAAYVIGAVAGWIVIGVLIALVLR